VHQALIHKILGNDVKAITPLSGGDINAVYRVSLANQEGVIKLNQASKFPEMLAKEKHGLELLAASNTVKVPEVWGQELQGDWQYLWLEYISSGNCTHFFWDNFGRKLAELHSTSTSLFGLETDNYIGSIVQVNTQMNRWADFFVNCRLIPQLKRAVDNKVINRDELRRIEAIANYCEDLWPVEPPALIHGDLWSGNYLVGENQVPVLIDPAVYYGHREMDLGMMLLFGGFDDRLFDVYRSVFPLESGWRSRIPYNQLYPLLVHLNLFGRGYLGQIHAIVRQFS